MLTMEVDIKEVEQGREGAAKNIEEAWAWRGSPATLR